MGMFVGQDALCVCVIEGSERCLGKNFTLFSIRRTPTIIQSALSSQSVVEIVAGYDIFSFTVARGEPASVFFPFLKLYPPLCLEQ